LDRAGRQQPISYSPRFLYDWETERNEGEERGNKVIKRESARTTSDPRRSSSTCHQAFKEKRKGKRELPDTTTLRKLGLLSECCQAAGSVCVQITKEWGKPGAGPRCSSRTTPQHLVLPARATCTVKVPILGRVVLILSSLKTCTTRNQSKRTWMVFKQETASAKETGVSRRPKRSRQGTWSKIRCRIERGLGHDIWPCGIDRRG
jgi:hypothetical protein